MAQNYFTDIVGGTQQAFQRGQQSVESARQQVGQNQAARALARGDTRAAREAYGRAGMVEQVDVLGQREAAQTEARRKQEEQAEALAYTRQQDTDKAKRQTALDQMKFAGDIANALLQVPEEQRAQALAMFNPTFEAMGWPPDVITQLNQQPLTDQNLRMFGTAMGREVEKIQLPSTMGAIPTGYMYDPQLGELRPVPGGPQAMPRATTAAAAQRAPEGAPEGLSKDIRTQATSLRKEFNARPEVKDYRSKSSSVANMRVFATRASPASDMSMIFLFMKMLDPTSVVREGEYATAQNATSIPERIRNQYNKAINGTGLNPKQRQDFLSQAESILLNAETSYQTAQAEYADYARLSGVPTELLFGEQVRTPVPTQAQRGGMLLRPGVPGAPPPSPQARATGSRTNPPPYATAEERELWSVMTAEEKAAVWDEGK
jgi:hypothetical protein